VPAGPLPLDAYSNGTRLLVEGYVPRYENERISISYSTVGHDYFKTMSTRIVEGRGFTEHDEEGSPRVVVVNQTTARQFWPDQSAIGKRVQIGNSKSPYYEVVGVAEDGKYFLLGEPPTEYLFLPHLQNYEGKMTFIARTAGPPEQLGEPIRQEIAALDNELPVSGIKPMPDFLDRVISGPKSLSGLATVFGTIALLMAVVGLYGVISYSVAQRTKEFGIRVALGAGSERVLRLVLREALILICIGVAIGIGASIAARRIIESLLYGITGTDSLTFVSVSLLLGLVAVIACYVPARRAAKIDPMVALRYE